MTSKAQPEFDDAARAERELRKEEATLRKAQEDYPDPRAVASDRHGSFPQSDREAAALTLHRRVESDFVYHSPTPDMIPVFARLRNMARYLAHDMIDATPPGRELSLALSCLEEAVMWANAGIARQAPADTPRDQPDPKDPRQGVNPFAR